MRVLCFLSLALLAHPVAGPPEGWHKSLKDGVKAARKSAKPILVVTLWKDGV